jgi:hypothetical protein
MSTYENNACNDLGERAFPNTTSIQSTDEWCSMGLQLYLEGAGAQHLL